MAEIKPARRAKRGKARAPKVPPCAPIVIEAPSPCVDGGAAAAKRTAGGPCEVEATVFRDGHGVLRAVARWRAPGAADWRETRLECVNPGLDLWRGRFPLEKAGLHLFCVEAWTDRYASWLADLKKRVDGGQADVRSEALEGAAILRDAVGRAGGNAKPLEAALAALEGAPGPGEALAAASGGGVPALMLALDPRADAVRSPELPVYADRPLASFGAWYEMFPRSQGRDPSRSGTFRDAAARLDDIRSMGFDVVYLPPIHPIGRTARKGRNNSLACAPGDPGSPWAVGNEHGGHDAVEPSLGTLDDFDRFAAAARARGMEVALDFALQCSPDHPYVREHPDWFQHRPDGSIKYAENPPKKYQDIYPLDFTTADREGLWLEMLRLVRFWLGHGVRIFRVDNPHTKPVAFWRWLIGEVQSRDPDALFLAEAFTRPPMMRALAKAGFTQSYTYFTWRNTKRELADYALELAYGPGRDYFRPNFFANTPDILPPILQTGGPAAFRMRLILAATLSPVYGIYSGFELCESAALPGREEYLDSEKYQLKPRDWDTPGNIKALVAAVNRIRRENPALAALSNVRFLEADNESILFYAKTATDPASGKRNTLLIAVNLDPVRRQECMVSVPPEVAGGTGSYPVTDLLDGEVYRWGERNYVMLDPSVRQAHILRVG